MTFEGFNIVTVKIAGTSVSETFYPENLYFHVNYTGRQTNPQVGCFHRNIHIWIFIFHWEYQDRDIQISVGLCLSCKNFKKCTHNGFWWADFTDYKSCAILKLVFTVTLPFWIIILKGGKKMSYMLYLNFHTHVMKTLLYTYIFQSTSKGTFQHGRHSFLDFCFLLFEKLSSADFLLTCVSRHQYNIFHCHSFLENNYFILIMSSSLLQLNGTLHL